MNSSSRPQSQTSRIQQQALFKQLNDLSERATKHWKLPEPLKKSEKDPGIGYEFEFITNKGDLVKNAALVEDFFSLYRDEENFFSGAFDPNIFLKESAFVAKKSEIIRQISSINSEEKSHDKDNETGVRVYLLLAHKIVLPVNYFPFKGYLIQKPEIRSPENEHAQAGCVVYFFQNSGTILIDTIHIAKELQAEREQKVDGLLKEYGFNPQVVKNNKEKNRQTVLKWLLTFEHPQKSDQKAALIKLVADLGNVKGVFHEVRNPVLITKDKESESDEKDKDSEALKTARQQAANSLEAFHTIDARYLKFAYHRPVSVAEDRLRKERQYFLLNFPQTLKSGEKLAIDLETVMGFIIEYSKSVCSEYKTNFEADLALCAEFRSGKQPKMKGFGRDATTDPIVLNNTSLWQNRFDKHFTHLYLHNVPRLEQPRFSYRRASVGFEILVDEDYFEPFGIHPYHDMTPPQPEYTRWGHIWDIIRKAWGYKPPQTPDTLFCPVAHSVETDLFAYKYQANPPYFTRYYTIPEHTVHVKFPSHFEFTSESRKECFYQLPETDPKSKLNNPDNQRKELLRSIEKEEAIPRFTHTIEMTACVSYTYFLKSAVRVWHLVLKPYTSDISELDIIKLMRFFSGSQEHESEDKRREQMRQIEFSIHSQTGAKAQSEQNGKRSSLLNYFPFPVFKSEPDYDKTDRRIQKAAWYVQTGSWFVGWLALGLIIVWLWRWKLPEVMETFWQWHPTLFYEKAIYWLIGIFALSRAWSWLFDGIDDLIRDLFSQMRRKIRGLFIKEDVEEQMPWLEKPDNLIQLLEDLTGVRYEYNQNKRLGRHLEKADQAVSLRNIRSGVVEIDTGDNSPDQIDKAGSSDGSELVHDDNFLGFGKELDPNLTPEKRNEIRKTIKELYKNLHDDEIPMSDKPESFTVEEYADYVFKAYCGICLGIFDYDRMGFQEIDDTLVPLPKSKTEKSFLVIHRGVLAMLGYDDNVMDTFWDTLGTNPYLLIPSAVLAHNDMVIRDTENRLDKLLGDLRKDQSRFAIPELIEQRNAIDDLLNDDILGDVFQYKTEQELYKVGMERRGIAERVKDARSKLEQLDKLISIVQAERDGDYQRRIQDIVSIVGAFSFYQIVHDFFLNEVAKEIPEKIKDKTIKVIKIEDFPSWILKPVNWLNEGINAIFHFEIVPNDRSYDPLDLAHSIFIGLILFLVINILRDPNKRRIYQRSLTWRRRNHHRTLPKTNAPSSKNRSSAAKRPTKTER